MIFRTEYKVPSRFITLTPDRPVVLAGSCFTQNIAEKMTECLWDAVTPAGTLFNPSSIVSALRMMIDEKDGKCLFESSLFETEDEVRSWFFDSGFVASNRDICLREFESRALALRQALTKGETLIITFGTSICYRHVLSDKIVGNCHKQSESNFKRERLSVDNIVLDWSRLLHYMKGIYPGLKVIFTVSPVRHLKDGFEGNKRSKAILILAVEELCNVFDWCDYFPAYEIVNDDLRDYRFYASDLVHPSKEAIEYVWEKFCDTYINKEGKELLKKGEKIVKGLSHELRPLAGNEISDLRMKKEKERIESILKEYESLKNRYPYLRDLKFCR